MKAATVLLALTLLASSCGSGAKPASSAAEVAPRSTYALLAGNTTKAHAALDFLPEGPRLEALLARARAITGSGGNAQVAVLDAAGTRAVAFARPADRKHLDRALDAAGIVHAHVRGWTVFSRQRRSVELVRHAKEHLSDARWFRLPAVQADASFVLRGLTVTASAHGDTTDARRTTPGGGSNSPHPLAAFVPEDAVAAAAVHDGARVFGGLSIASQLQRGLGLRVDHLALAAPRDAVVFARPAQPVPTVTLLADGASKGAAARVVSDLAPNAPPGVQARIDGVSLTVVSLGPVDLYYGSFDGKTVITDDTGARLGSKVSALAPPGLPDETSDWAYLDVRHGLPALESLAALSGTRLSPAFVSRVSPLRSLLVYRTHTATHETLVVEIRR